MTVEELYEFLLRGLNDRTLHPDDVVAVRVLADDGSYDVIAEMNLPVTADEISGRECAVFEGEVIRYTDYV